MGVGVEVGVGVGVAVTSSLLSLTAAMTVQGYYAFFALVNLGTLTFIWYTVLLTTYYLLLATYYLLPTTYAHLHMVHGTHR